MSIQLDICADDDRLARSESTSEVEDRLRREFARELHDGVAQSLTLMLLDLEFFRREQYGRQSVLTAIEDLQQRTAHVINELRDVLADLRGDWAAEEVIGVTLAEQLAEFEARHGVTTIIRTLHSWPTRMPAFAAQQVRRIVQEAAHNAVTHGGARLIIVTLDREDGNLLMTVTDDGAGIAELKPLSTGHGLVGMTERALLLGGTLHIERSRERGITVRLTFPHRRITVHR